MASSNISAEKAAEAENDFRSSLEDVVILATGLKGYCKTVDDLIGMAELALNNDGQLHLLIDIVTKNKR